MESIHDKTPESNLVEPLPMLPSDFLQTLLSCLPENIDLEAFVGRLVDFVANDPQKRYDDIFYYDIIKPLLLRVIDVRDDFEKDIRTVSQMDENDTPVEEKVALARNALMFCRDSLDDALNFYDVSTYTSEEPLFNPKRQTVIKTIPTDDPALHRIVEESLGSGYERNGAVIRKERVSCYILRKEQNSTEG